MEPTLKLCLSFPEGTFFVHQANIPANLPAIVSKWINRNRNEKMYKKYLVNYDESVGHSILILLCIFTFVTILLTTINSDLIACPIYETDSPYGMIIAVKGEVTIKKPDGSVIDAKVGIHLQKGDILKTGKRAIAQMIFPDDTTLSIGRNAEYAAIYGRYKDSTGEDKIKIDPTKNQLWIVGGVWVKGDHKELFKNKTGPTASTGFRGTQFIMSENSIEGWMEISILEGSVNVVGIDWISLPDIYFIDPLNKGNETLDYDFIFSEVDDQNSLQDILGIDPPILLEAGYWSRIIAGQSPMSPMAGMAPGHSDFEFFPNPIPEPASLMLLGIGITVLARIGRKKRIRK